MYVKLVNPRTGQSMVFKADLEVYYERQLPMDRNGIDRRQAWLEGEGYDARHFLLWEGGGEGEKIEVSEIYLPGHNGKQKVMLTNWDAWLTNETGRSIDRIFRYAGTPVFPA